MFNGRRSGSSRLSARRNSKIKMLMSSWKNMPVNSTNGILAVDSHGYRYAIRQSRMHTRLGFVTRQTEQSGFQTVCGKCRNSFMIML